MAPEGCDLLLFFSRSSGGSSGVSGRSGGFGSGGFGSGGFRTGGGGVGASSSGVGAFFGDGFSGRGFGGGFFSSLFTASGEGEHAGSNGDSSKLLHDVWAP